MGAQTMAVDPIFCDRCTTELRPGTGSFYRIDIEAVADPTPPDLPDDQQPADLRRDIEQLLREMAGLSAQEAMDQVHRRLTLFLCVPCYRRWIEDPVSSLS